MLSPTPPHPARRATSCYVRYRPHPTARCRRCASAPCTVFVTDTPLLTSAQVIRIYDEANLSATHPVKVQFTEPKAWIGHFEYDELELLP